MSDVPSNPYASPQPLIELAPELSTFSAVAQGSGRLTWTDFKSGERLSRGLPFNVRFLGVALIAVGCLMLAINEGWQWNHPFVIFFLVIAVSYTIRWLRTRRTLRLLWAHPLGLSAPHTVAASPNGLLVRTDHAITLLGWAKIRCYRVNARVLLLFFEPTGQWQVIPRSYFSTNEDWHQFVDILQANVPQG